MKTVIEMAIEAGFEIDLDEICIPSASDVYTGVEAELLRFAELVRADAIADEREACANVCEGWDFVPGGHEFTPQQLTKNLTDTIATQIRARG